MLVIINVLERILVKNTDGGCKHVIENQTIPEIPTVNFEGIGLFSPGHINVPSRLESGISSHTYTHAHTTLLRCVRTEDRNTTTKYMCYIHKK